MLAIFLPTADVFSQKIKMGLLVYGGGGDWYANPTSLKNLAKFSNQNYFSIQLKQKYIIK